MPVNKSRKKLLYGLLAALALSYGSCAVVAMLLMSQGNRGIGQEAPVAARTRHATSAAALSGRQIENLLYDRLRTEGVVQVPGTAWTLYVRQVQGRVLQDFAYFHQDALSGRCDHFGRAKEAKLLVDLATKQICIHVHCCSMSSDDGPRVWCEGRVFPIELPDDVSFLQRRSRRTVVARLAGLPVLAVQLSLRVVQFLDDNAQPTPVSGS
jgi:hypothetical protein